jgi:hypothetical protein
MHPDPLRIEEPRGVGRLVAAGSLVVFGGLHLFIAANTKTEPLAALVPLGWALGVTGLVAALALSQRWRIGAVLALAFVAGTAVWIIVYIVIFRSAFEELGDPAPSPTISAEPSSER